MLCPEMLWCPGSLAVPRAGRGSQQAGLVALSLAEAEGHEGMMSLPAQPIHSVPLVRLAVPACRDRSVAMRSAGQRGLCRPLPGTAGTAGSGFTARLPPSLKAGQCPQEAALGRGPPPPHPSPGRDPPAHPSPGRECPPHIHPQGWVVPALHSLRLAACKKQQQK